MNSSKYVASFGLAYLVVSTVSALLVILKEMNPALKDWMKALSGHHWLSHGIFILVAFGLLGLLLKTAKVGEDWPANRTCFNVLAGTLLGSLLIVGFFLLH